MKTIPTATYRVQFGPAFTFQDLKGVIPFLSQLGICCIYASPIFKARKGSTHGYDVVDFNEINPELGGREGFDSLVAEVKRHGMSWLQDMVPNHMAYSAQNQILVDVGENGPNSKYFDFFDVEWDHPYEGIKGRVLAPFLGSFYGECLENGEIQLCYDEKGFAVRYFDMRFPLRIESYSNLLTYHLSSLRRRLPSNQPDFIKLHGILGVLYVLRTLPSGEVSNERYDQIRFIKIMLWELYNQNPEIRMFMDETIRILNDRPGREESIRFMERLLGDQHYRLSHWKVAAEEINYRRFFNINELISLRIENPKVFDHVHSLVLKLVDEGSVSGLRIDHIDGLHDPSLYLRELHKRTGGIYTVVEKILAFGESIPDFWPVAGTTGYDFLNAVNGLFCDWKNEKAFDRIYSRFAGGTFSFEEIVFEKKKLIAERRMAGDVENLAHIIKRISDRYMRGSDLTMLGIKRAVVQVLASFPIYRTYFNGDSFRPEDREFIRLTLEKAEEEDPDLVHEFHFIEELHDPEFVAGLPEEDKREWLNAMMRFQQLTAPLMAKGFEDTVLYVYNRLLSLNEVGGYPEKFGIPVDAFHEFNRRRFRSHPHSLASTSTHDGKRGEDVRARINVLSEMPREWEGRLRAWSKINRRFKTIVDGRLVPETNLEYGLYQMVLGAFPTSEEANGEFLDRMKAYAIKAVREAKTHTSWLLPNNEYESAVISFMESILRPGARNLFLNEFLPFQKKIAFFGIWNSLAQILLKIASPGVPDFYQGTELWDLNLVDPDNRRPVDFAQRETFLKDISRRPDKDILSLIADLLASKEDGRVKLFMIHRALKARQVKAELFDEGAYFPIKVKGKHRRRVVAFGRQRGKVCAVAAVPRFLVGLVKEGKSPLGGLVWEDTCLVPLRLCRGPWKNWITGQVLGREHSLPLGEVFEHFPAALLINGEPIPSSRD
jgi:(1->4)-alpha-D-glucan 1-alpha-D-glucosylmutase